MQPAMLPFLSLSLRIKRAVLRPAMRMGLATLVICAAWTATASPPKSTTTVSPLDFNQDIRPILAAHCFSCHGQDPTTRQANLRLDIRESAMALRSGHRAIEPGKPESSALVARINAANPALLMPPAGSNHKLTPEQKTRLTQWVKQGAPYDLHWAFKPLSRPAPPPVKNRAWLQNPIDAFVLARLEKAGLAPAPEADRYTLIRRLSLDLTGLPPSLSEVADFVKDRSPNAYEKVVDRLLASPHYGEHWARMWLDLARYADTQGYEKDQPRTMWRYRDWVIDAFNSDMPYDRFTVEQLAGDLLPNPTDSQILATAFHRNTMTNTEGGVDGEEFRVAVKDRVDTTGQVWMGLTIGCAKCHSHKYDPITQQDYYRFYALFNQTEDANRGDEYPTALMPTEDQKRRLEALDAKLKGLREAFWKESPGQKEQQAAWESTLAHAGLWTPLRLESASTESGAVLKIRPDGAILVSGAHKEKDLYTLTFPLPADPVKSLRLEALKDPSLPNGGPGRDAGDQNVVTSELVVEWVAPGQTQRTPVPLQNGRADFEQGGWPIGNAIDGNADTGWAWAPQNAKPHVAVFDLKTPLMARGGRLIVTIRQNYPRLSHGCFRLSVSGSDPALLKAELRPLSELAAIPADRRTPDEQKKLDEAFRQTYAPTAALAKELNTAEKERAALESGAPRIPVMKDLPKDRQRVTHLQQRGNFLDPGEVVSPAVPEAFGPMPSGAPANRLGAAQWLVSRDNPLTPRVAVNRFWARLFGTGLVETEEDFGTQGTPPTHPELLDWLASAFIAGVGDRVPGVGNNAAMEEKRKEGRDLIENPIPDTRHPAPAAWDVKALLKLIVTSAAYRQAGQETAEKRSVDPKNRLLSRGPRFRLPAEEIRDQALTVSGLLSAKMYGPPVMPPQPDGIWHTVYSGLKWQTSGGEDRYRRGLYTFWRRSSPYPSMTTFDAGSGEFCVVRRIRTNTPLQALVTLNDPAFVEAAGALGKAMLEAKLPGTRERIAYGFQRVLTRPPTEAETARLMRLYTDTLAKYNDRQEEAKALLHAANAAPVVNSTLAEQAACTTLANVLLNLDETLTKP